MSAHPNPAGADMAGRLSRAFEQLGLQADADAAAKLLDYLAQMQRWNRTYNLTAIRDPHQMLVQHLFDSLAAVGPLQRRAGPARGIRQGLRRWIRWRSAWRRPGGHAA